jgi:hypothetical protein
VVIRVFPCVITLTEHSGALAGSMIIENVAFMHAMGNSINVAMRR